MKKQFWTQDWFAGLLISVLFLFLIGSPFIQGLERVAYDFGVRHSSRDAGSQINIVAIDDDSLEKIGRWPWPRKTLAQMLDKLAAAGAKVVGSTVLISEPQVDPGLASIREIADFVSQSDLNNAGASAATLKQKLAAAQVALDNDSLLAGSVTKSANVVLPMQFTPGEVVGNAPGELPEYVSRNKVNVTDNIGAEDAGYQPLETIAALPPVVGIGGAAAAIGHLVTLLDVDGAVRTEPLVIKYYADYYPSQALMIAAQSLNYKVGDIQVNLGEGVQLGKLNIATDTALQMQTFFYKGEDGKSVFPVFSFFDVLSDKVTPDFKDKIVLIGPTAFGLGNSLATPLSASEGAMTPVMIMAHTVASILNQNFFVAPTWAYWLEILVLLGIAAYLIVLLPKLKAAQGALISAALLAGLLLTHFILMTTKGYWLQLMAPAALLVAGHLLLTTKRYLVTERGKTKADTESAESNKMLGLAYQQQKQLDMAFEKFRKCPADDAMLDLLYNLASDFEAKRQFNKAENVYHYIAQHDAKYKDVSAKLARAKNISETVMLGGAAAGGHPGGTLLLDGGGVQKPMLGRYQVEKELGKGAMGVVYFGRDPKINRTVAIKTMALSQEFGADELEEVKSRFFREAETAGRLQHPNIVAIYDVGEEHDLAYIAMEFLKGHDLGRYCKADALMPVPLVMGIVYKAAMALDYAHQQSVVHRDIKPANIMYDPDTKTLKLTDFGIARITDSSKTKTGMVLGTPSYMSPEQLSGRRVDGRSDLFSLGVMLYQLITGKLPFHGESMATLMYKIANEPHRDILEARPELVQTKPCLQAIINRALKKDVEERYQTGSDFARDLQACAKKTG